MGIPPITNSIWKDLIISFENLELKSLAFQLIVIRTKERFRNKEISIENAIEILYNFCNDNKKGNNLIADIKTIFGDSVINVKLKTEKSKNSEDPIEINENVIIPENSDISEDNLRANDIEQETKMNYLEAEPSRYQNKLNWLE